MEPAESAAEFTPQLQSRWLSEALGRRVTAPRLEPLATAGVSGQIIRVHLDDSTAIVAKLPPADPVVRERQRALGMYEREARFYRELAAQVALRTPQCFYASEDVLLLEDLAPATAATFTDGLSEERVDAVIDGLIAMHGAWQASSELGDLGWLWRVGTAEAERWQQNLEDRLPRFIDRHRAALTASDVRVAERVTAGLASLMLVAAALPSTLCHGDPGPPNLMFGHPSGDPVFVDWQLAAARHGALDLAWLLTLGVPVSLREEREQEWLDRYGSRLGLDGADLRRAYELGVALALRAPIWMGGAPERERSAHVDAYAAATIPRAFGAARNHDLSTMIVDWQQ